MAYELVASRTGQYAVDWEVVDRLVRSYWQASYQLNYSTSKTESEASWYNPFSWSLPDIKQIDVPWDKVREASAVQGTRDMLKFVKSAQLDMRSVANELDFRLGETARLKTQFTDYMKSVQSGNMSAIDRAVGDYEGMIEVSRFIRDTSADIVAIGSTIATGGAAVGLLGASSGLKGYGKYQDTGSVGAAVTYGAGSMVLGAFKIGGAKLSGGEEAVFIVFQGVLETGTSLVAGDTVAKAIKKGGLKIASTGAAQALFSQPWVIESFAKIPFPFTIMVGNQEFAIDMADKVVEKISKKLFEKGVKAGTSRAIDALKPEEVAVPQTRSSSGVADEALLYNQILLKLAIVNMEKGVGHGW